MITDISKKRIALIGIGMGGGNGATMTAEASAFCRSAGLLIGARRMLDSVAPQEGGGQRRIA